MPKTRQTTGKPATRKAGNPFTASKERAARKAKPAPVSLDQAEHDADATLAGAARDAPPHRTLTTVGRKGRQAKPTAPASTPETYMPASPLVSRTRCSAKQSHKRVYARLRRAMAVHR